MNSPYLVPAIWATDGFSIVSISEFFFKVWWSAQSKYIFGE
ncbi:hypothetical protein ACFLXB_01315 [Chloroflexota bacterium]